MVTLRIWLSYDLGIRGDYDGLYKWLDEHKAVETGNSCASFMFQFEDNNDQTIKNTLLSEWECIDTNRNTRFYVIRKSVKDGVDGMRGSYLIGRRKSNPWEGYADRESEDDSEE